MINNNGYRSDINGLRAIAVAAVVLYHFDILGFNGGFVGVDVFFVISGFLMTKIVLEGIENNSFSILLFYWARAKRIAPALIALCSILLLLGWLALPADEYSELGSQVRYSLLFLSNVKFINEAGYFDVATIDKWLLHTWSLSVEWQFYLIFPLFAVVTRKLSTDRRAFIAAMVIGGVVAFCASIVFASSKPVVNFYSLQTRAWEMIAGGLVFVFHSVLSSRSAVSKFTQPLGLLLIFASIFSFDKSFVWPGTYTLIPVAGAVMVIAANAEKSFILDNKPMQWVGRNSYSIYLWHWPIVVSIVYMQQQSNYFWVVTGLFMTLIFGWGSRKLFEDRCRIILSGQNPLIGFLILFVAAFSAFNGASSIFNSGYPDRIPSVVTATVKELYNRNPRQSECLISHGVEGRSCSYGGSELSAIVLGDSHADAVVNAVAESLPNENQGVQEWAYASCPTIEGANTVSSDRNCKEFNEWALNKLESIKSGIPVVVVNRSSSYALGDEGGWNFPKNTPYVYFSKRYSAAEPEFLNDYSRHFIGTVCKIAARHPVYLVRPFPEMPVHVPRIMSRALMFGVEYDVSISLSDYHERHSFVWKIQDEAQNKCGAKILNPLPYLCDNNRCYGSKEGRPLYYDASHLSEHGNRLLVPMFRNVFEDNG
ncbi:acyltransferase [Neisseriaceae bacterium JH1-16]|nr:acyltransferase [Neisseriaceae bacterium JH1-16]